MAATPSHRLQAVRAADLLVLDFDFYNLVPAAGELRRVDPNAPAYVVMRFPFQHLLEEAFEEGKHEDWAARLWNRYLRGLFAGEPIDLAGAYGGGPSRVAFAVPDEVEAVPATLEELLAFLATCRLNVAWTAEGPPAAGFFLGSWLSDFLDLLGLGGGRRWSGGIAGSRPRPRGGLVEPELDQTAIELPYRLILSPPSRAGFAHESAPPSIPQLDRVELWHSRLGLSPREEGTPRDHAKREARAIWVRDVERDGLWNSHNPLNPPPDLDEPFLASMSEFDRHAIAHLTSNWQALDGTAPLEVERLALSALGGWLDATGRWDERPDELPLEEWTNRTALGRDHFVKLVYEGAAWPLGHRLSYVKITERKWQEGIPGRPAALRQRYEVIVRDPELHYGTGTADAFARLMPFKRVRLLTLVASRVDRPTDESLFPVTVEGQPFRFAVEAEDGHGNQTRFSMPLVFIAPARVNDAGMGIASAEFKAGGGHGVGLGGSPVALVPEGSGEKGGTTFPVARVAFAARLGGGLRAGFHPELLEADVGLPAVEIATGQGATTPVKYHSAYREHGLGGANPGEVFAELLQPPKLELGAAADKAGGLLSPSMAIAGLSRATGPLGDDLKGLAGGVFDPDAFFDGAAKLLGTIELRKVLELVTQGPLEKKAPKLVTQQLPDVPLAAEWTFTPKLKKYPSDKPVFVPKGDARLTLRAYAEAKGPQPKAFVECTLENVELHLIADFKCIVVPIEKMHFLAPAGKKPDIDVVLGEIAFVGPLSFVEELRRYLPLDGFSDPPALEVTPQGIASGFSIALPDIAVGMFALQHVSVGARLELPFTDDPLTATFNFCARNEPFLLTVSAFGGGGFFLVKVDPKLVQRLEASFEFGAAISMNFGVASGGVHVMAGIYFAFETGKGALLTGYFRVGGNVSVLGIVSVSIELYLGLTYESASGKAVGRATLTVEIELCLFSTSVEVSCERKLAGSAGDPPFEKLLAPYEDPDEPTRTIDPWADYCRAYA